MKVINIHSLPNIDKELNQSEHMFLTHLVLNCPHYRKVAYECEGFKILDNSVIELGSAMDPGLVISAANLIRADEVVLPDAYMDGFLTRRLISEHLDTFKRELPGTQLMAVVHGNDETDWMHTLHWILNTPEIDTIGIPKCTAKMHPRGRVHFIEKAIRECAKLEAPPFIHLLGLQYSFNELFMLSDDIKNCIRSCDTILGEYFEVTDTTFRPDGWILNLETGEVIKR